MASLFFEGFSRCDARHTERRENHNMGRCPEHESLILLGGALNRGSVKPGEIENDDSIRSRRQKPHPDAVPMPIFPEALAQGPPFHHQTGAARNLVPRGNTNTPRSKANLLLDAGRHARPSHPLFPTHQRVHGPGSSRLLHPTTAPGEVLISHPVESAL
jgi:hypothetical protein